MNESDRLWWAELLARDRRAKQRRRLAGQCWRAIRAPLMAIAIALVCYTASFGHYFECLGLPVRSRDQGWLGPTLRGDRSAVAFGGFAISENSAGGLYDFYKPLCCLWVWANGLPFRECEHRSGYSRSRAGL